MEICIVPPGSEVPKWSSVKKVEKVPDWLQEKTLALKKVNSKFPSNKKSFRDWHVIMLKSGATLKFEQADKLIREDSDETMNDDTNSGTELSCKEPKEEIREDLDETMNDDTNSGTELSCKEAREESVKVSDDLNGTNQKSKTRCNNIELDLHFPSLKAEEELVLSTKVEFSFLTELHFGTSEPGGTIQISMYG